MDKHHHHHPEHDKLVILIEEVDLETYAKRGEKPPKAHRYRVRIDDAYYVVHKSHITGHELLELAGKIPPTAFILTQKIRGGAVRTIELDEVVDLEAHGVERFNTLPREVQEG
jgi:hypothetical protein